MSETTYPENWRDIDTTLYHRAVKVFNSVRKLLSVKMTLHADTQIEQGDIFLFNHFSRFETFIPQFLIFEKTGAYSCAIASGEFFKDQNVLSRFLRNVGVFPHNHDRLFPLLAAQILRGRKVIIFPEGGMVKDHRVIDHQGRYSIYSRISGERRKQHTGAAVLAQGLETFKEAILEAYDNKQYAQLLKWKEELHLDSLDMLLATAIKPTLIVPSNITFYPIRTTENLLLNAVELFSGELSMRQTEELLVEGNILFKNTDMDLRLGNPINPRNAWNWRTRQLVKLIKSEFTSLDQVFALNSAPKNWKQKLLGNEFKNSANLTRNRYMEEIYANVTINLSHLASTLILYCVEHGQQEINRKRFYNCLYIAVKYLQNNSQIHLHRSLLNPYDYSELISGHSKRFDHFIDMAKSSGLITDSNDNYQFLPKLLQEHDFDRIRLENLIAVYNNEAKPISEITKIMADALAECDHIDAKKLTAWHFDDEKRDLAWEVHVYNKACYDDINEHETASADPSPFFLESEQDNDTGVLLVHGLLASPAELRSYGDYLVKRNFTVMGVRLKGHGSSPCALRNQTWENWYESVLRGYHILKSHCRRIIVIGFSTGGALSLKLASEHLPEIIGVVAVSVPIKFLNPAFMLVPLLHGTNKLVDWVSSYEGVKPFFENPTEHPDINYRHVPVKCLYELRMLINHMDDCLPLCKAPVLLLQGDHDPIVSVKSAHEVMGKLGSLNKQLQYIQSARHGVLMENIGGTWDAIDSFMNECLTETNTTLTGQS